MTGCDIIRSDDRFCRAVLSAHSASDTLILIDGELKQILADARGALLVHNMGDILIAEELQSRENRVRRGLTESAERVCLYVIAELFHSVDILKSALTLGYLIKHLIKALDTHTAGSALSAGFVDREFKEELRHIDHTGVLIHNDEADRKSVV